MSLVHHYYDDGRSCIQNSGCMCSAPHGSYHCCHSLPPHVRNTIFPGAASGIEKKSCTFKATVRCMRSILGTAWTTAPHVFSFLHSLCWLATRLIWLGISSLMTSNVSYETKKQHHTIQNQTVQRIANFRCQTNEFATLICDFPRA